MYKIVAIAGLIIRQFLLPNPFSVFGRWGELYNILASGMLSLLAYISVGLIYEKGSAPFWGSVLFTIAYVLYSFEIRLVLKPYPNQWIMGLIAVLVIFFDIGIIKYSRKKLSANSSFLNGTMKKKKYY